MDKRPFFVIGHMVNSLYDVDVFVESGCNALEADIQFSATGTPTWVYHGIPCDCNREGTRSAEIPEYLDYLRNVTHVGSGKFRGKVRLLFLDLKTSSITSGYHHHHRAGQLIARLLFEHLWRNVSPSNALNVLLYVEGLEARDVFQGALDTFSAHPDSRSWRDCIGFDFGGMAPLEEVDQTFAALGISDHRWAGSGNSNWFAYMAGRYDRLKDIVRCRDGSLQGCDFVDKGYAWTLDKASSIAREIELGLDGVITNYPESALAALKWPSVARIARLAGPSDSPWTRIRTPH